MPAAARKPLRAAQVGDGFVGGLLSAIWALACVTVAGVLHVVKRPSLLIGFAALALAFWLGETLTALLLGALLVGLVVWAVAGRESFRAVAGVTVRNAWRYRWVYRRQWRRVMAGCRLSREC